MPSGILRRFNQRVAQRISHGFTLRLPRPLAERVPLLFFLGLVSLGIAGWIYRDIIRTDKQEIYQYQNPIPVESSAFQTSTAALGFPLVGGNRADLLLNGNAIFPAMLKEIASAQRSVNMETFIFRSDDAGEPFVAALTAAARRGAEVRLLFDAVGSKIAPRDRKRMKEAGVRFSAYRPLLTFRLHKVSQRTHRKILVVDGRVAYAGGVGIGKEWLGDGHKKGEWRDTQVRVEGPVVAQMQAIFSENWLFTTGEILFGEAFYPTLKPAGNTTAQAMRSSGGDASSVAKMIYFVAIESAKHRIYITNPYFLPDSQIQKVLMKAARRGVDVKLVLPGRLSDAPLVRAASCFSYKRLLASGIKIYEYQPSMTHSKNFVVDSIYSTVGSINFDVRSMSVNAEDGLAFYDKAFAAQMESLFEKDKADSKEITLDQWKKRGPFRRLAELAARTWQPYY